MIVTFRIAHRTERSKSNCRIARRCFHDLTILERATPEEASDEVGRCTVFDRAKRVEPLEFEIYVVCGHSIADTHQGRRILNIREEFPNVLEPAQGTVRTAGWRDSGSHGHGWLLVLSCSVVEYKKPAPAGVPGGSCRVVKLVGDDCYEPLRAALLQQQQLHIATPVGRFLMACTITSDFTRDDDLAGREQFRSLNLTCRCGCVLLAR